VAGEREENAGVRQYTGAARAADARSWPLRTVPAELRRRYLEAGFWDDENLGAFVHRLVGAHPRLAFRIWSRTRPFEDELGGVYRRALRLAGGLRRLGIGPGDVVAFQLPNWAEAAETFYGVSVLGATLVPIVHFYGPKELRFILRESGARVLVTADRFGRQDFLAGLEVLRPELPALEHVVVVRTAESAALPAGARSFEALADAPPLPEPLPVDPSWPAVVGYTSGTTAAPKGVIHTHRSLLSEVRQLAATMPADDRTNLIGAPVAHAIGMLGGLLLPPHRARAIHLLDVWEPLVVLDAMVKADLTSGNGSTYFLTSLLDAPGFGPEHVERMPWAGLGGSPIPVAVSERAERLGIAVTRNYGSTEHPSTTGSKRDDPREKRNHTDGHPLPGVELRLVDAEGREVDVGEPGEIRSRGPDLCAGYTNPALNEAFDSQGWYRSGDVGVLDAEGYLTITDRLKDIIIRGGENVSAAEVEELLQRLPGVAEVAVVAAPDPRLGEHGCAFFRVLPGAAAPDLAALRRHLEAEGLARQKWPEELRVLSEFPRTPSGKIVKAELRRRLREESA
jgi:acyl-CoA synthetase (AMP-forming)/AMP-acid ligase II